MLYPERCSSGRLKKAQPAATNRELIRWASSGGFIEATCHTLRPHILQCLRLFRWAGFYNASKLAKPIWLQRKESCTWEAAATHLRHLKPGSLPSSCPDFGQLRECTFLSFPQGGAITPPTPKAFLTTHSPFSTLSSLGMSLNNLWYCELYLLGA